MSPEPIIEVVTGDPWYVNLLIGLIGAVIGAGASIWATQRVIGEAQKETREDRHRDLRARQAAIVAEFRLGAELLERPNIQHSWAQVPTDAYAAGAHTLTAAHDLEFVRLAVSGARRYNALAAMSDAAGRWAEDLRELAPNLRRALTDAADEIEANL